MNRTLLVLAVGAIPLLVNAASTHDASKVFEQNATLDNNITQKERSIRISGDNFLLDGKKFRYVAGSLHYFRMPSQLWRDRLRKLRAAGLDAVSTYVEWSYHEPEERQYRWEGDYDLVRFLQIAAEENLLVLLRPGPYVCAERDLGGLPYWLLGKYPAIRLRTSDTNYMFEVTRWMNLLLEKVKPLLYGNGGPIIMVQVENEYGSYTACDGGYMRALRDLMKKHVEEAALLYTTDGTALSLLRCGSVNDTLTTIDFGPGDNQQSAFSNLRTVMPSGPLVNSEYYPGWLTHWGEKLAQVNSKKVVDNLKKMLDFGVSVNIYMFHGGTNFEFSSGANYDGVYQPDITSYDYDAPLTESGNYTQKYFDIKNALEQYNTWAKNITAPKVTPCTAYGTVALTPRLALLSSSGKNLLGVNETVFKGAQLPTFERRRQRAGLLLFETVVPPGNRERLLHVAKPRDRVYVYVDGEYVGVLSRMHRLYSIFVMLQPTSTLSLLVENQGRINYGAHLKDLKGILSTVTLDRVTLSGSWSVVGYPLENLNTLDNRTETLDNLEETLDKGPIIYEGSFVLEETPRDTFLDPSGWKKGYAWVNGHNLGRYWLEPGPQVTLYVPGVYLRLGSNTIRLLELENAPQIQNIRLIDSPIFKTDLNLNITRI